MAAHISLPIAPPLSCSSYGRNVTKAELVANGKNSSSRLRGRLPVLSFADPSQRGCGLTSFGVTERRPRIHRLSSLTRPLRAQPTSQSQSSTSSAEEGKASSDSNAQEEKKGEEGSSLEMTPDEIGRGISQLRKDRVATGLENPSSSSQFWQGVWEETRMIEWPSFSRVFGTTAVVITIILASTFVILAVNAVFAELSDLVF
eukprot:TRINITY_DN7057_c0_g5_i1.p1 TRINITY_DN7057_c0_g5~~TRINITY_DN7057_c0_g5_i1.p1  ORF type:complete len:210 (+),score=23.67 TRINITY_DN7057_c0_g5_i1:26-631(+)